MKTITFASQKGSRAGTRPNMTAITGKAATIKDVAREARVSVASVSRSLNGNGGVTAETALRIRAAADRLHYVPHAAARMLITRRSNTIGALLPDLYGEFFSELIRGIDLAARARGLHLLVSSSHDGAADAAAALRAMQGRVDGMLILSAHVDAAFLQANLPRSLPAVLLNSAVTSPAYAVLNVDNYAGAYAMVQHLLGAGHASVALIAGPAGNFDAQQRDKGYRAAMAKHAPQAPITVLAGDFSEESGHRAVQQHGRQRSWEIRLQERRIHMRGQNQHAVDPALHRAQRGGCIRGAVVRAGYQQVQPARARGQVDAPDQFGEELAVQVGQQCANGVAAAGDQHARGGVRHVVQPIGGGADAQGGFGGDAAVAVERTRNGGHRDPGLASHVFDGCRLAGDCRHVGSCSRT